MIILLSSCSAVFIWNRFNILLGNLVICNDRFSHIAQWFPTSRLHWNSGFRGLAKRKVTMDMWY